METLGASLEVLRSATLLQPQAAKKTRYPKKIAFVFSAHVQKHKLSLKDLSSRQVVQRGQVVSVSVVVGGECKLDSRGGREEVSQVMGISFTRAATITLTPRAEQVRSRGASMPMLTLTLTSLSLSGETSTMASASSSSCGKINNRGKLSVRRVKQCTIKLSRKTDATSIKQG